MQHNTLSKHNQKLPFTRYDFGWVLLCIGMAIGAGTVADASTNWLEGNLGIYYRSDHCLSCHLGSAGHLFKKPFLKAIPVMTTPILSSHYLGKNWGIFLGVIYFLMIIHGFLSTLSPWFSTAPRT
ncbi:transport protein YhjV [Escherichia coli]|uniref:Transport protein YhjV n=1 Tax=Escherichia coli TaxID=562 RepID=A0A376KKN3_ECOLX|nr:transport protein YhjV [Escherichia coli]